MEKKKPKKRGSYQKRPKAEYEEFHIRLPKGLANYVRMIAKADEISINLAILEMLNLYKAGSLARETAMERFNSEHEQ